MRAHRAKRRRSSGEEDCLDLQFDLPVDGPSQPEYQVENPSIYEEEVSVIAQPAIGWNEAAQEVQVQEAQPERPLDPPPAYFAPIDLSEMPIVSEVRGPLAPFPRIKPIDRKVIEFPRISESRFSSWNELAEPIGDQLRIFEAVEELRAPEPSHLAEIRLEPAEREEQAEAGFDLPLPVAPLEKRSVACGIDAAIFAVGSMAFAGIAFALGGPIKFSKPMALASMACLGFLFAFYQLIFLCYAKATPGMRAAGLEICSFSGATPIRNIRAVRAIALLLSCAALGLGLLWVFLDEDRLGWHDRMTHTYMRERS